MVLQNVVFPAGQIGGRELYVRSSVVSDEPEQSCRIRQGETISTDTYMNAFDVGVWKKYTDIQDLLLVWRLYGNGRIKICWKREGCEAACLAEIQVGDDAAAFCEGKYLLREYEKLEEGLLYLEFYADTVSFLEAWFETEAPAKKEIRISLVICTYRRRKQLERLIRTIESVKEKDNDWLHTVVIDNASELTELPCHGNITVYQNANNGGSGGFARGMKETVKNLHIFPATHVLLMDDDVILEAESLYRLRALLAYIRPEYREEVVAGRMFRLDKRNVQYTAAEMWNQGDLRHIGWNCDMTLPENVACMNDNRDAEYGGWWFCCYPIEFVRENMPLPFFLHCDDVEYGLRHGGTPIILNGIQVWHETYEYRQTPVRAYYDCRNSLFVNSLYAGRSVTAAQMRQCLDRIREAHVRQDYILEYFLIRACGDYLKGWKWFMRKDDSAIHASLIKERKADRYINCIRGKMLEKMVNASWRFFMKNKVGSKYYKK